MPRTYDVFNEFFDDVFDRPVLRNSASVMKTDVHEKDGSYILDIDLPGYKKEDVNIELDKGYLTISAKHEVSDEEKDSKGNIIHCMDVSGGMCDNTSLNGIILLQVVDLNQRFLFFIHSGQPPCISVFVTTGRPPTQSCSFIKAQFAGCSVSFIKV